MESENEQKAEITCMEKVPLGNAGSTNVNPNDRQEMSACSWGWKEGRHYIERLLKSKFCWLALLVGVVAVGVIVIGAMEKTNPGKCPSVECPREWLGYKRKCYFISEDEKDWISSKMLCAENASWLATFENQEEMHSLAKLLKIDDCWIGLHKRGESFYWENGTALDVNLFPIQNHSDCAYFNDFIVSTSACSLPRRWICIKPLGTGVLSLQLS